MHNAKYMSADEAVKLIKSGDRIYIQGSASIPEVLIDALTRRGHELRDVTLYQAFAIHKRVAPYCKPEYRDSFFVDAFFISGSVRDWVNEGYGAANPRFLGQVPALFRDGTCPLDAVFLNCSMPNPEGYVSFGVSGDLAVSAVETAKVVIAQINPHMPFSYGDPVIHISKLDAAVHVDDPLVEFPTAVPTPKDIAVGNYIAEIIPDGATIQIGVGGIPNAVARALMDHKHLGLHTEALTDGMLPLLREGVIDNSQKVIMPGKSVATLALGSRALYDFMDYNEDIIFKDVAYTNDPFIISRNPKVMAINSALEIDLTGQICADSIGERQYSGVGGQQDFVQGASRSEGGKSFIAMLSTTGKGVSKIKPVLTPGAGVVTTRFQSNYVVTEHGAVDLRGKNMAERAHLLISIADPAHREELERAACKRFGYAFLRTAPSLITREA
ncbi:MAG: acetyl-CoA hydrolase/transferase family protein [Bacteroides sp.]|nr:acetyl-CoA hydrolase/transferase family protein [Bacteroidales bacterium]MBD5316087.1 acetyl-CoA hydrolase/transferase family protein [Bacteroides sp.]MBD5316131.1 acetyl-CoA hydrolase/transferase family protein [Bacteroides sp.]MBD5377922.1 acetyl-CoA hydrolase/transferase family protein [Bacteroides sp.]